MKNMKIDLGAFVLASFVCCIAATTAMLTGANKSVVVALASTGLVSCAVAVILSNIIRLAEMIQKDQGK